MYDDHDYGGNDAGKHLASRSDSQRLFLDFIGVARDAHRRDRQGVGFLSLSLSLYMRARACAVHVRQGECILACVCVCAHDSTCPTAPPNTHAHTPFPRDKQTHAPPHARRILVISVGRQRARRAVGKRHYPRHSFPPRQPCHSVSSRYLSVYLSVVCLYLSL